MATKTPSPAQLAARAKFAAAAKAGKFKRKAKPKARAANPSKRTAELRNRWGVTIKRGNWVQGRTSRGDVVEGVIAKIERTGDYARAYGPRVVLDNGVSLGIDDVTQTLGPMTLDPSGVVRQNPLTRVKVKSPSQRTGAPPSKRLTKRRKATAKAPAGYYANPVDPGLGKGSAAKQAPFTYEVQRWGASAGEWFRIAGFDYPEDAVKYAKAMAKQNPAWRIRVVDNYGR